MEGLTAGSGFGGATASAGTTRSSTDEASINGNRPTSEGEDVVKILRREAILLGVALVCGFVLIPLAIWAVGNRILGPYTHLQDPTAGTGPMRLLADYYGGLAHGSIIFWCVGFGPYVLLWLIRLIYGLLRPTPATST
jgi:hypothetical protein